MLFILPSFPLPYEHWKRQCNNCLTTFQIMFCGTLGSFERCPNEIGARSHVFPPFHFNVGNGCQDWHSCFNAFATNILRMKMASECVKMMREGCPRRYGYTWLACSFSLPMLKTILVIVTLHHGCVWEALNIVTVNTIIPIFDLIQHFGL